jgi:DNA polymerase-3 subunit alpha
MAAPDFVHLRLHSEFSIVDGTVRIDDAVAAAAADSMPALALTDLSNAFGLVKFYKATRAAGVKPVFGADVYVTHAAERDQPWRAVVARPVAAGYLRLAEWLSRAYRTHQHRGHAELAREWFGDGHRWADRTLRRPRRRRGTARCCRVTRPPPLRAARDWSALVPRALLPGSAARGPPRRRPDGLRRATS